jgi:hypothetical protein
MYPFVGKVKDFGKFEKPVPGKSLWSKLFDVKINGTRPSTNITSPMANSAADSNSVDKNEEQKAQIEYDENGTVKGPFKIIRPERPKEMQMQPPQNRGYRNVSTGHGFPYRRR